MALLHDGKRREALHAFEAISPRALPTRVRVSFVRDRIVGAKHTVVAQQTLDPGGDDILRFLFQRRTRPQAGAT
jgi:hypothetical protein